jgi:hypothetical protein
MTTRQDKPKYIYFVRDKALGKSCTGIYFLSYKLEEALEYIHKLKEETSNKDFIIDREKSLFFKV